MYLYNSFYSLHRFKAALESSKKFKIVHQNTDEELRNRHDDVCKTMHKWFMYILYSILIIDYLLMVLLLK